MKGRPDSENSFTASGSTKVNLQEASHSSTRRNNTACIPDHGLLTMVVEESVMDSRTFMKHEVTCSDMLIKLEERYD